jgi:hypothetical protein
MPKSIRKQNGKLRPVQPPQLDEMEFTIVDNPDRCAMQQCLSRSYQLPSQALPGEDCPTEDEGAYHDPSICDCAPGSQDSQVHIDILHSIAKIEKLGSELHNTPKVTVEPVMQFKAGDKIDVGVEHAHQSISEEVYLTNEFYLDGVK